MKLRPLPPTATAFLEDSWPILGPHFEGVDARIGAGTALAARWQHRDSNDIDLVMPNSTDFRRVRGSVDAIQTPMERLSYHDVDVDASSMITVIHHSGHHVALSWMLASPVTEEPLSGEREPISGLPLESNEEILAKKIRNRLLAAQQAYPRDLYDLAWAIRHENETWKTAISLGSRARRRSLAETVGQLPPNRADAKLLPQVIRPADPDLERNSLKIVADAIARHLEESAG